MQVDRRPLRVNLGVQQASQRGGQRGVALLVHAAVPDEHRVGLQLVAVRAQVFRKRWTADLFLAFDDEAKVERRPARGEEMLDRFDGHHVVAFVVRGAAGPEITVVHDGLERRRMPEVDGVCGLDVVVAVDRQVRLARQALPVGDDHRQAALHDIDDLHFHIQGRKAVAEPPRVAQAVLAALGQGADRGDAQLFDQVVEVGLATGLSKGDGRVKQGLRRRHRSTTFRARD